MIAAQQNHLTVSHFLRIGIDDLLSELFRLFYLLLELFIRNVGTSVRIPVKMVLFLQSTEPHQKIP